MIGVSSLTPSCCACLAIIVSRIMIVVSSLAHSCCVCHLVLPQECARMERYVWQMACRLTREGLNFATMKPGEQCAMMAGRCTTLRLPAHNLAMEQSTVK